jgi:ABC-type microcin C transport system duplicated ATPase subunit YejF
VDLRIAPGEVVGLVGESGSGKSLTALSIMRLLPPGARISSGRILFEGIDLSTLSERAINERRGRDIGMIFQDPLTALNPAIPVGRQIVDSLRTHQAIGRQAAWARAVELLDLVGIAHPAERERRHAATGDDGPGGIQRSEAADRRRADDRAGCDGASAGDRAAGPDPAADGHFDPVHQP